MEDLLHLYRLPYDPRRPVMCFDALPVQLLGEVVMPLPMQADQPTCVDYEYARGGTAVLLVAFEPLTGRRLVEVSTQRTKADYTAAFSSAWQRCGPLPSRSCWSRTT